MKKPKSNGGAVPLKKTPGTSAGTEAWVPAQEDQALATHLQGQLNELAIQLSNQRVRYVQTERQIIEQMNSISVSLQGVIAKLRPPPLLAPKQVTP